MGFNELTHGERGELIRPRFSRQVGRLDSAGGTETLISTSQLDAGYVVYGPYIPVLPGKYVVYFRYKCLKPIGKIVFDVVSNLGKCVHAQTEILAKSMHPEWDVVELSFDVDQDVTGLETRVLVDGVSACFKFGSEIIKIE